MSKIAALVVAVMCILALYVIYLQRAWRIARAVAKRVKRVEP